MTTCGKCGAEIPDGKQACLWERRDGDLFISFSCPKCTEEMDRAGITKDITAELIGRE